MLQKCPTNARGEWALLELTDVLFITIRTPFGLSRVGKTPQSVTSVPNLDNFS